MIFQCDFHIHSVLSPCADALMTPANIVNMARLQGLDVIAVTDHQSCGNCAATMDTAKKLGGPLVIPGLEAESAEEIHLICLFPDLDAAQKMTDLIRLHLPPIANRPDIFGDQIYYDADDQPRGTEEILLIQAGGLSVDEIADHAVALGGVCLPAHIDRSSYSLLAVLGGVPPRFMGTTMEISARIDPEDFLAAHPELAGCRLIRNSDSHNLVDLATSGWPHDIQLSGPQLTARDVIRSLGGPP